MAWYDARKGRGGDWDPIDILMRRSLDNGATWEEARLLVGHNQFGVMQPINNLILISDAHTGEIHVLFCVNYETLYYMKSADEGLTFTEAVNITTVMEGFRSEYDWRVIATGPGHGLQHSNGRLIVPVWMSTGEGQEFQDPTKKGHRPSDLSVIYSDDHGQTWERGDFVARTRDGYLHPNETVAVELSDGRVLFNIRTEQDTYRRLISISPDGARDWGTPYYDEALEEPICFGSILRLPPGETGGTQPILFVNPSDLSRPASVWKISDRLSVQTYQRRGLTLKVSFDDCRTWTVRKTIWLEGAQYSDLTLASDGSILCLYERGDATGWYLTLARFNREWMLE